MDAALRRAARPVPASPARLARRAITARLTGAGGRGGTRGGGAVREKALTIPAGAGKSSILKTITAYLSTYDHEIPGAGTEVRLPRWLGVPL